MTKEEIFSENLEIFKFYRDIKIIDSFDIYNIKLEYHNSWDWLMPVVQKCLKINEENTGAFFSLIYKLLP